MKKLLTALVLPLAAVQAYGQTFTTYGPSDPQSITAGYISDYSPSGTVVQAGGSVTMANGSTYEHGNLSFQNNGTWSSQTASLDLFVSAGAVAISGSAAPGFFNLQFQNGGAVSLTNTGGANVAGQLLFGTATTVSTVRANSSNGALRFTDNATYTGGSSDAQHVNGYVSKTGNDGFTFPVGSGTDVRTLTISAPASATNEYSVAWITGDPGTNGDPSNANVMHPVSAVTAPIVSVSTQGQWDWVPVSGTGAGLTVTVSLPAGLTAVTTTDLRLVGWNGSSWVNLSGSATASGNTEGATLSGTMIAGITAVGVGTLSLPLPITFGSFTVQKQGCEALLNWTTLMEHNNDYFAVERSTDGRNFSTIAKVDAAGKSNTLQSYSYRDRSPASGMNYYRIVQVDADGQRSNTGTEQLESDCAEGIIKVYPTITKGTLYVALPPGYEAAKIMLVDMHGRTITANVSMGGSLRTIQLPPVAAGTYLLSVMHNSKMETFKILYQP